MILKKLVQNKNMRKVAHKIRVLMRVPSDMVLSRKIWDAYKSDVSKISMMPAGNLLALSRRDLKKYKKVKKTIEQLNIDILKGKHRVRVGFVVYSSSMWSCSALFEKMQESKKFAPMIILCDLLDGTKEARDKIHNDAVSFFRKRNYTVVDARGGGLEEELQKIDLLIYTTPFRIFQKGLNVEEIPLRVLTCYVSYSFMIAEREEKFDLPMYQLVWKYFVDTLAYKRLIKNKCRTGDDNVMFCGFLKMDGLLTNGKNNEKSYWKGKRSAKKIIYAPHHSVYDEEAGFSTFDLNGRAMLGLAKKYQDETSWIIKPHPLLGGRIIKNGYFKDIKEYNDYLDEWNKLPNASVVTGGDYLPIFKSSDSMILDSVSFLAEYQYTHKPLLLLTRETQRFNEFGDELREVLYEVNGSDINGIEKYIRDVVLNGEDPMKSRREAFFDKNLNYYEYNGGLLASDSIYAFLKRSFGGDDDKA